MIGNSLNWFIFRYFAEFTADSREIINLYACVPQFTWIRNFSPNDFYLLFYLNLNTDYTTHTKTRSYTHRHGRIDSAYVPAHRSSDAMCTCVRSKSLLAIAMLPMPHHSLRPCAPNTPTHLTRRICTIAHRSPYNCAVRLSSPTTIYVSVSGRYHKQTHSRPILACRTRVRSNNSSLTRQRVLYL